MQTKVEINDAALQAAFERMIRFGEDPDSLLHAIGRQIKANVQLGFTTGVDPYDKPWAPLKVRQGQPLRDKGRLMDSVDYQVVGDEVAIGTNLSYAPVHQHGAVIEPKPGKFWRTEHRRYRSGDTVTVTQPAKLVFPGPDGRLIFAKKVTIPARRMFPLDGLPDAWRDDLLAICGGEAGGAWWGAGPNS